MLEQILTVGFFTAFFSAMVRMAVPLIYAGLGEMFAEKAGILNIGMEGVMLSGAFCSFAGAMFSGSLFIGLLCGIPHFLRPSSSLTELPPDQGTYNLLPEASFQEY